MSFREIAEATIFIERIPGKENLNFLLLHNAGGNHHFFAQQLDTLKQYGSIIQLDLPGHGASSALTDNSMDNLAKLVTQIYQPYKDQPLCLVGLNNGANLAMHVATTEALPLHSLILIDPPMLMNASFVAEIKQFIQQLENDNADYSAFIEAMVTQLLPGVDVVQQNIARQAFLQVNKESLSATFQSLINWDLQTVVCLQKIILPTLCILTDEHHCTYEKVQRYAPQFTLGKVIDSKCWATLAVPQQLNAMMAQFLTNRMNQTVK